MKKIIDTSTQFFTKDKAEAIANKMNAADDDWTYKAVHDPKGTGYSFIEVYDEDGEFISKL